MFGIDDPSAAATLPTPEAAGTVGFWTEGNPGTGTPATLMRASFFNGLQQELLNILAAAGVTPSKTTYNQLLTSLTALYGHGRLINFRSFASSGTYTPTAGTNSVDIIGVAGGGAGGGTAITSSGQAAGGAGGGGGGWFRKRMTSGFSGASMVVGAGGTPVAAAAGGAGGSTSFGTYTASGGGGGTGGPAVSNTGVQLNGTGSAGVGNVSADISGAGTIGLYAIITTFGQISGQGGASLMGGGGGLVGTGVGQGAPSPGAGGGGAAAGPSTATTQIGGAGGAGIILIWEYA